MDEELQHRLEMQNIYQKQLRVLEQQEAKLGSYAPAHIVTERDEIQQKLAELEKQLESVAPYLAVEGELVAHIYKVAGNIIYAPPHLLGRDYLVVRGHALLDSGRHVLLYGLAGAGKTALAATIADQRISDGKGPVVWLQLGYATDELIFDAFVKRFATSEESQKIIRLQENLDRIVAIRELLARAEIGLLVLDNAWNGSALHEVLKVIPPAVPVLVTAREKFLLPELVEVGDLASDAALQLLSYHASQPDYSTDINAQRLCKALGYHAYALEIAGATLAIDGYTPGELLQQIADSPHDLPMPGDFAEQGRESVKRLLDVSYAALTPEEQTALRTFGALFAPGATAALVAVYLQQPLPATERALKVLVRRSLAKQKRQFDNSFYSLHALTFSYARALFKTTAQDYQATVAAVEHYVTQRAQDFRLLAADQVNILEATRLAQLTNPTALIAILYNLAVGGYFANQGCTRDFLNLLDGAIEAVQRLGSELSAALYYLLFERGNARLRRGELELADESFQASLPIAPNDATRACLLGNLGVVHSELGRTDEAGLYFQQGYALAKVIKDDVALDHVLVQQAYAIGRQGDYETANRIAAEAVEVNRRRGDPERLSLALLNFGASEFNVGIQKFLAILHDAFRLAEDVQSRNVMAYAHQMLGYAYQAYEKYSEAQSHFEQAYRLFHELEYIPEEAQMLDLMKRFGYIPPEKISL